MEEIDFTRFGLAFVFVIGLIGAMAFLLRRFAAKQKWLGMPDSNSRLRVVETRYLDHKRRLVLVSRDEAEHLLLLGDGRETVIESPVNTAKVKQNEHA